MRIVPPSLSHSLPCSNYSHALLMSRADYLGLTMTYRSSSRGGTMPCPYWHVNCIVIMVQETMLLKFHGYIFPVMPRGYSLATDVL